MSLSKFMCKRCGYESEDKGSLVKHLQKLTPCPTLYQDLSRDDLINEMKKPVLTEGHQCEFCNKFFSTRQGKYQHKLICKEKPAEESIIIDNKVKNIINEICTKMVQQEVERINERITSEDPSMNSNLPPLTNKLLKKLFNEDFYQKVLEKFYKATHKVVQAGITDITTEDTHIEIKRWKCWKEVAGQLFAYNAYDPKFNLSAIMFGKYASDCKESAISILSNSNIKVQEAEVVVVLRDPITNSVNSIIPIDNVF